VGTSDPYSGSGDPSYQVLPWPKFGNPDDLFGGCTVDGLAAPCFLATQLMNSGAATKCPENNCGPGIGVDGSGNLVLIDRVGFDTATGALGAWVRDYHNDTTTYSNGTYDDETGNIISMGPPDETE
jgi:hypothetical protein